jgi:UDP-N-acetylmuramate dehydrogenase
VSKTRPALRSLPDRIRQVVFFEIGGLLLITPPFVWLSGVPLVDSIGLLAIIALIAAVWNGCYNTLFDMVEGRLTGRMADQRPWRLRLAHALGFEGGLLTLSLPVIMWWTGMGWLTALIADIGLALSYVVYAFVFNLAYDRMFPIPQAPGATPRVIDDTDLGPLNTFALPARAAHLARIEEAAQIAWLTRQPAWAEAPRLVLGGGSNIVLDGDFPGWVLQVAISGRERVGEDDDFILVRAGGGENWHDFVRWTLEQGWGGLENLSLIPGTVGAAPIQNIGAYGLELAARFEHLEAVSLEDGSTRRFDAADCRFGYRDSVFKHEEAGRWLIASVTFRLPRHWQPVTSYADVAAELAARGITAPTPLDISDAVIAIRRRKLPDPAEIGNAGSFFKNPVVDAATLQALRAQHPALPAYPQPDGSAKLAAGWLIEQTGWKGRDLGPVGSYERQALVLVNRGGAKGEDVRRLADAIRADVAAKYGVELEPEPVFVSARP